MGSRDLQWTTMLLLTTTLLTVQANAFETKDGQTDRRYTKDNRNILTSEPILKHDEESPSEADVANSINKEKESALESSTGRNNGRSNTSNSEVNYEESNTEGKSISNETNQHEPRKDATVWDLEKSQRESKLENDRVPINIDLDKTNDTRHEGKQLDIHPELNSFEDIHVFEEYDDEIVIEIVDDDTAAGKSSETHIYLEQKTLDDAVQFGVKTMEELVQVKEPMWYQMGLFLDRNDPASRVAAFGAPRNSMAMKLSQWGYLSLEASRKLAESFPENVSRQATGFPGSFQPRLLQDDCPLKGLPRCPPASRRYRTADGTCNNLKEPWKGSAMLPMRRFLPPAYNDGIQSVRRSVFGSRLPSARDISVTVHRDRDREIPTVTLMFMQWGQFVDHDVTSVVKSTSFGGSVPRCCERGGREMLPQDLRHPSCLPIEVSEDDWFLGQFGIRCMEFIRSAPSTRINCDLGWREQINQVTPYIDASAIYGSDIDTSNSVRTFRNGKLFYGRPRQQGPLQPPDPPGGELCRSGALTNDCFQSGDGRVSEQPGLTAFHTIWIRFHNKVATTLRQFNPTWSDEKIFQETRKIVYSLVQHITYREFLPIVLGPEVMRLFELNLVPQGYYDKYEGRINPAIANSFGAAAFRFGHSMVQNSYVRTDHRHRPLFNNVTLHEDLNNAENIWSFGSLDRLLLGFANQPAQRRDEFICDELSNHLFQSTDAPFGMDLSAINIQRGRDHGLPSYTSWRQPCGLSPVKTWTDLERIFNVESVSRFQALYRHVDDIDLFSGGLAEKPVRGGVVGPTFACIIAQQFLNLRKGDRFWYENGGFESSFTPAQLQQIRHVTFAYVLCQTTEEIDTIQPFVFLSPDDVRNVRLPCSDINNFDLSPWIERGLDDLDNKIDFDDDFSRFKRHAKKRKIKMTTTKPTVTRPTVKTKTKTKKKRTTTETPLKITITNVTSSTVKVQKKYGGGNVVVNAIPARPSYTDYVPQNYLFDMTDTKTTTPAIKYEKPVEVNIKIQYFLPVTEQTTTVRKKNKRPSTKPSNSYAQSDTILVTQRPVTSKPQQLDYPVYLRPQTYNDVPIRPNDHFERPTTKPRPVQTYNEPKPIYVYSRPTNDMYRPSGYNNYRPSGSLNIYTNSDSYSTTKRPYVRPQSNYNSYNAYADIVFEDRPFSTSERPYAYRPDSNHYNYDDTYTTKRPYYRPQQQGYGDETFFDYTKRPNVQNIYNRDDTINEVYSQLLNENDRIDDLPKKPIFGQYNFNESTKKPSGLVNDKISRPATIYSIGHVHKLDNSEISDKLDFKTRFVTRHRGVNTNDYSDDDRFVKISSVKANAFIGDRTAELYSVQKRDGEVDLNQVGEVDGGSIRVLQIDVSPSEVEDKHWLVYNATDEIVPLLPVPDVNLNVSCSNELPRPMKVSRKKQRGDGRSL